MKAYILQEPELEFYQGLHIDIKYGLLNFGPLDKDSLQAPKEIKLGIIGTNETIEGVIEWINKCENGVNPKISNKPNLYPQFPGFGVGKSLPTILKYDSSLNRILSNLEIQRVQNKKTYKDKVDEAISILYEHAQYLCQNKNIDIIVFALPPSLLKLIHSEFNESGLTYDFHDLLKAKMMKLKKPSQLLLPSTYDSNAPSFSKKFNSSIQDDATRAWNFYVALYYKAGGTPWRIKRIASDLTTCYIGVGFYKSLNQNTVQTSVAQIFNERGEGIILRGGQAQFSKGDKRPFLSNNDAYNLITEALNKYKQEHQTIPARVVIHKTSSFRTEEMDGFNQAINEKGINFTDFVTIADSFTKLFRTKEYPPLRGTFLSLDETNHVLYTNGSIDFYQTYPGPYIPKPLSLQFFSVNQTPKFIAEELLVLTKMNWNNTQFASAQPITLEAARKVSKVLKYLKENEDVEARYSYYM